MSTTTTTAVTSSAFASATIEDVMKMVEEGKLKHYTTGSRRGYLSRKGNGYVEKYNGRYGKGYVHVAPRWDTSQYVAVHYYIEA